MKLEHDLTGEDAAVAAIKGTWRQLRALKKSRMGHDHGQGDSGRSFFTSWLHHIMGELGEIAVSRSTGLAVTSFFEDLKAGDVGGRIDVKATDHLAGRLSIYPNSVDARPFVLVTLDKLHAAVVGWILAGDGKNEKYWWPEGRPPCFMVPQSALLPIESLVEHLQRSNAL